MPYFMRCSVCHAQSDFKACSPDRLPRRAKANGWLVKRCHTGGRASRTYYFCPACVEAKRTNYGDVARGWEHRQPKPYPITDCHKAAKIVLAKYPYAVMESVRLAHVVVEKPGGKPLGQALLRSNAWLLAAEKVLYGDFVSTYL